MGIHEERCVALDHPDLQDNPTVWWDTDLIAKIVHEHVLNWEVDAVCSLLGFLLLVDILLCTFPWLATHRHFSTPRADRLTWGSILSC